MNIPWQPSVQQPLDEIPAMLKRDANNVAPWMKNTKPKDWQPPWVQPPTDK